ncbi:probable RNA-binding protein CG14230 isoform X2 [Colletes gigas]|uniref:probable RNA-binding protein CG14230 isoform X2 n=1 Tax=Colletes gigas TaxID=935657 RepID=UPI001C9AF7AB|nr:probable RNA-binding protein CG14230 isoform X2 [Colletes gigas]
MMNTVKYKEVKTNGINDSEKKRLESLKQKKEAFRTKELMVQNALKNLDNKSNHNKIIFDEDIDKVDQPKIKKKLRNQKHSLFNDDDDDRDNDESFWDDSKFDITEKPRKEIITLGNDERFKIDKHFMEDDHVLDKNNITENNDESDLQKEKEWQMDILENILGVPIQTASKSKEMNKDLKFPKKQMIRYDPTKSDHKEYEIIAEKSEVDTKNVKKKKRAKNNENTVENSQTEVSKDVYFSVSGSLTKSLKERGQFSLLKTCPKEETNENEEPEYNMSTIDSRKEKKFQFSFDRKNPFKYDSSDDEKENKEAEKKIECTADQMLKETNNFFFDINDTRFNEAIKFFSEGVESGENFSNLRQKLKQIMRSKIQRNIKRNQPGGRKRKIKR